MVSYPKEEQCEFPNCTRKAVKVITFNRKKMRACNKHKVKDGMVIGE